MGAVGVVHRLTGAQLDPGRRPEREVRGGRPRTSRCARSDGPVRKSTQRGELIPVVWLGPLVVHLERSRQAVTAGAFTRRHPL